MADDEVLARFVRDGRLVVVPTKRAKLRVVLGHLAHEFEPGVRYAEREVVDVLSGYHEDHAMLRRALVDEGFLAREGGVYWRSGGSVEV